MPEASEPKKETVRITLPPRRGEAAAPEEDDTVLINLPSRPPTSEPPTSAPLVAKPANVPIPRPPVSQNPLPAAPAGGVPPPPVASPPPTAPVTIAPAAPQPVLNAIPMPLCWGLVLVSAAILIIEIWNYIS